MSLSLIRIRPLKVMSSRRIGKAAVAKDLPTRTDKTILGLTFCAICCWVNSEVSLGVKEIAQSIITTSSSVFGNVLTLSILGAFVPKVKVVRRIESKNAGQLVLRTWSTEETTVAERTGS